MEHIQPKFKFNLRNRHNQYPYQCSENPAIRDLFYRTYVVNSTPSPEQEALGINKLSQKLKSSCNQYRKAMLEKYMQVQERCEKDRKQIISSFQDNQVSDRYKFCKCNFCKCKGCQGCQYKECQKIAKYLCDECKSFCYCENCKQYNKTCNSCVKTSFIKIEQIPSSYNYPEFEQFISTKSKDTKT